jgi:sugar phosphate isomerase/epimerase
VDDATAVGAECIFMSGGPPGRISTEAAEAAFAEAIAPVSAYAAERAVPLAMEHNNTLRRDLGFIHTLADAIDYCRDIGFGICVELNNCWIERRPETQFRRGVDLFRIVQVSDFVVGTVDTPNRAVPGDGDIPLERLIGSLLDAGYRGPFELEALGPRIEAEGYQSAVPRGARWVSDLLERLGA